MSHEKTSKVNWPPAAKPNRNGWQPDGTYMAGEGDTIGGLAKTYLGDHSKWPQIWNKQPQYIREEQMAHAKAFKTSEIKPGLRLYMPQRAINKAREIGAAGPVHIAGDTFGSQSEDMEAINRFMRSSTANNIKAAGIKNSWPNWYDNLGWYSKNFDSSTYNTARAKRNAFSIANARNQSESEAVQNVINTGMTTEQMNVNPVVKPVTKKRTGKTTVRRVQKKGITKPSGSNQQQSQQQSQNQETLTVTSKKWRPPWWGIAAGLGVAGFAFHKATSK